MAKILIAYTTNSGSTAEVADVIAETLRQDHNTIEVRRLEEVGDLEPYQAVLIGAPMILGWHKAALSFIKRNHQSLAGKKVAYFCMAMSLTQSSGGEFVPPLWIDPDLPTPPRRPGKLSLKERYATAANYIAPMPKNAPDVKPLSIAFFGGKLELFRLKWWQMLFVMIVIGAQPGDRRNWPAIREWAGNLGALLL